MALKTIYKSTGEGPRPLPEPSSIPSGPVQAGDRVGAIMKADAHEVHLFGYGVYQGTIDSPYFGAPNPKINLDNGKTVWGYQCWWSHEARIKAMIGGRKIIMVEPEPNPE